MCVFLLQTKLLHRQEVFFHYFFTYLLKCQLLRTQNSGYYSSRRKWDGILRSPEYDNGILMVRKVCQSGCIWINQKEYFLSQAMIGEYVGLKEGIGGDIEVYYGPIYLGKLKT